MHTTNKSYCPLGIVHEYRHKKKPL